MPISQSVQFYENRIEKIIKEAMIRQIGFYSNYLHIPQDEISNLTSFFSLLERYAFPVGLVNSFIIGAIALLMSEYRQNTGVPFKSLFRTLFGRENEYRSQKSISHQIVLAADSRVLASIRGESAQPCIDQIKALLTRGLLESIHPQDNFPNIVRAVVNKTSGLIGWEFNSVVNQRPQVVTARSL